MPLYPYACDLMPARRGAPEADARPTRSSAVQSLVYRQDEPSIALHAPPKLQAPDSTRPITSRSEADIAHWSFGGCTWTKFPHCGHVNAMSSSRFGDAYGAPQCGQMALAPVRGGRETRRAARSLISGFRVRAYSDSGYK